MQNRNDPTQQQGRVPTAPRQSEHGEIDSEERELLDDPEIRDEDLTESDEGEIVEDDDSEE